MTTTPVHRLGIVIPTLNEEVRLPRLLADLRDLRLSTVVVVADGGSLDTTVQCAREAGARVVHSTPGRGAQLRAGVDAVDTPWLLFLHADTRLPPPARRVLERWLEDPDPEAVAHFRFGLDGGALHHRLIEAGQRVREWSTGLVFGDQGLVVHRSRLARAGGVPALPLMEDVELLRRLRRSGAVCRLDATLPTSPRRYDGPGGFLAPARNALLLGLFLAGVPPKRLVALYRPAGGTPVPGGVRPADGTRQGQEPETGQDLRKPKQESKQEQERWSEPGPEPREHAGPGAAGARDTVLVFARAPVPGRVKTRLAADVGSMEATRIYRTLGRRVVDQIRSPEYRVTICHDPPDGGDLVRDWLGEVELDYQAQHPGDLGARMGAALDAALAAGAPAACVVGTDAPEVDRTVVREAFRALHAGADVVLGPALDGGYYLIGLREPHPELFAGIPWSTDRVLHASVERSASLGLRVALLHPLRDIDTVEDLDALFPRSEAPAPVSGPPTG